MEVIAAFSLSSASVPRRLHVVGNKCADHTAFFFPGELLAGVVSSSSSSSSSSSLSSSLGSRERDGNRSIRCGALHSQRPGIGSRDRRVAFLHARDRVVDFGRFKGSMLGTLSSSYLRWMVKNLKGGPLLEWAEYAEEVLQDPLYRDRLEWEKVEKLLAQSHDLDKLTSNRDALAPARMYGWDLDNDAAWSRVNFSLLGTSKGGQIPRKPIVKEPKQKPAAVKKSKVTLWTSTPGQEGQQSTGSLRDELNRRRQQRRDKLAVQREALERGKPLKSKKSEESCFPGRAGLLSKVKEEWTQ